MIVNIRRSVHLLLILLFSFISIKNIYANNGEEQNGSLKGTVTTNDNKPAESVEIVLKEINRTAETDDAGSFSIHNIKPGVYTLQVSLVGYEKNTQQVNIQSAQTISVNIILQLSKKQLQEVVVRTAGGYKTNATSASLRLQTPVLEVPQNIQIVTGKTLKDQQLISMSDGVVRNVSGTSRLEHWGDLYTNVNSRGSQVQAFRNGFNVVNSYWGPLTEDMSYVDHIEFVKGPASFMLANGDPSGLYNVVTKKPTGVNKGSAEITVGSYDLYRVAIDLDGKLSKDGKLLYRLNLAGQDKRSFRPFEYNNRYSIAPVVSYQVDSKTKIRLEYTFQHAKMSDVGSYYVFATKGYAVLPGDFTTLPPGVEPTLIDDHSSFLNIQRDISNSWKFTVQGAYLYYKQQGSSMWPATVNDDGTTVRATSSWDALSHMLLGQAFVNGDVQTGSIRHKILAGVDLGNKKYWADWGQYHEFDSTGAEFNTLNPDYSTQVNGYPNFDHDFSTLKERAKAIGGLQNQRYSSVYVQDELGFFNNLVRLTIAGRYTTVKQDEFGGDPVKSDHFTPRVGLSYSIDKSATLYAVYDQAFTPQSGMLTGGGSLKPLTGNNTEFGIKKDWANGRWSTTLAAYRILKNNEGIADPNSNPSNPTYLLIGQKRSQGIELDLRGKIIDGLSLITNYAYTDSRVTRVDKGGEGTYSVGDDVPSFSKHVANAWLTYEIQSGSVKGLGFSGGFTFMGNRNTFWDPSPDPSVKIPDYFKLDGGIYWQGGKIRVTANVFNVLNKYLYSGSYYSYLHAYYWQAEAPRNFRLSVAYNF